MSTIHLLRLPLLVVEEVLKCLTPIELFKLSECSKKLTNLIPLAGTRNYELFANFSANKIVINDCYYFGNVKFWSYIRNRSRLHADDDIISCFVRLLDLFKCGIHSLETRSETDIAEFESLLPIILKNDRPIKKYTLKGASISTENLKQIFEISESLKVYMNIPIFRFEQFPCFPNHLLIFPSYGITRSDLLALKQCVSIEIINSQFANKDLDAFLESWKKGEFPNLEFVRISNGKFRAGQELAGVRGWPRNIHNGYKQKRINNCTVGIVGGETIERVDGVKATIQLYVDCTFLLLSDEDAKWSTLNYT